MSEILGGSSVTSARDIAGRLNGLIIPDFDSPAGTAASDPNPISTAAPQPNPQARPNVTLYPAPQPQTFNNPLLQNVEEEHQPLQGIELPNFGEEEQQSGPAPLSDSQTDDDLEADLPDSPAAENFKKLRGVVKTERQAKRELEARLQETTNKLERFEKGEVVPDIIRAKDERIAQLEPFEKIVNLRNSKEYQKNFVEPAIAKRERLEKIGTDYGVPNEMMHKAVGIENERQLNDFVSRHFGDVGGLEVKQIIKEMQDLGARALDAEAEPEQTLQTMRAEFVTAEQNAAVQRASTFEAVAKDSWGKALEKTKTEGIYRELIIHPTDTEFNKNFAEPIQYQGAVQYGALIKKLAANGLTNLPPDLATGLARMVLLSIGGALTMDAKVKAENRANNLIQNTKRTNGYARPTIGGQNGAGHAMKAPASRPLLNPTSAAEAAARVFNK